MPPNAGDPLRAWAEALCDASSRGRSNESDLRHDLFLVLGPFLLNEVGLPPTAIQNERVSTAGRYDSLFGSALVEYKRPGLLTTEVERRRAARQAVDYLEDTGLGVNVAIVTDGETWGVLRDPEAQEGADVQLALDLGVTVPVDPVELFQWRQTSVETAERILSLVASVRAVPVTSGSIVATLGLRRGETNALIRELARVLGNRQPGSRADILFSQWLQLAGVAYGIGSQAEPWPRSGRERILGPQLADTLPGEVTFAESIFVLHTFIALSSKLIASEILALVGNYADERPSQWLAHDNQALAEKIAELEAGILVEHMRAPGLFAGDLFGWYALEVTSDLQLLTAVRGVLSAFAELAWAQLANVRGTAGDLLRDFYIATVPRLLRRALGEFFTPQWLAERVFSQAVALARTEERRVETILDPACGSGTFVVIAFNFLANQARAAGASERESVRAAVDHVTGFDINPISTLMTRVNLLLNLGALAEELPEVNFRVFQADSILLPEELVGEVPMEAQHDVIRLPLVIGDVFLPAALSSIAGVHALVRVVEASVSARRSVELFQTRLAVELRGLGLPQSEIDAAVEPTARIYKQLRRLHDEGRDGIWAKVIEQAFAPRLVGEVDLVVGNPPWISWKNTPQAWQDRSESLWKAFGLWQRRRRGGGVPLADLSTLLLARSIATYAQSGFVALLLPLSFLMADPGSRAIRACRLRTAAEDVTGVVTPVDIDYAPVFVDDFSSLSPFPDAATNPIALYCRPASSHSFPIDGVKWTRARPGLRLAPHDPWASARDRLAAEERELAPLEADDVASVWVTAAGPAGLTPLSTRIAPAYRWGQGFHTRGADGLYVCDVLTNEPSDDGLVRIRSRPDAGDNTRGEPAREGVVEAAFIWPLLRGEAVARLRYESPAEYVIVPHDPDDLDEALPVAELVQRAPRLFDFLEPLIPRLAARSAYDLDLDEERPFAIQGAFQYLDAASAYVASRYIAQDGRPPTTPVLPRFYPKLGRRTVPYFNNKTNFLRTGSESEASFIAVFVSSPSCQDLLARISMSTTISPRKLASLPIPVFDSANADHVRLAEIGLSSIDPEVWASNVEAADSLVREISVRPAASG